MSKITQAIFEHAFVPIRKRDMSDLTLRSPRSSVKNSSLVVPMPTNSLSVICLMVGLSHGCLICP